MVQYFYPRSPCGERPDPLDWYLMILENFYPRSPCGERQGHVHYMGVYEQISIHALLAESDPASAEMRQSRDYFYPRSPCGERPTPVFITSDTIMISIHALLAESDPRSSRAASMMALFLSTLSLRRATRNANVRYRRL